MRATALRLPARSLEAWQRRAGSPAAALLLLLLCAGVYLPGLSGVPTVDRDEARFAQASRQMLESDSLEGWIVPRIQDRPRLNKPPLIYWLQAGSTALLTGAEPARDAIWMYRVPSALAAMLTVLVTWRLGAALFDPRIGLLAAAMLAVAPVMLWEARQARADQALVACTTLAMWMLWRLWRGAGSGAAITLWLAVAAGIMVKGPITPMVAGLGALGCSAAAGQWRWLGRTRPALGTTILLLAVAPWVALVAREVGFETYARTVLDETLGRSASPAEGHAGPPGYHLVLLPVLFWPGAMLTGAALARLPARISRTSDPPLGRGPGARLARWLRGLRRGRTPELFLAAWIVPSWLVFELVSTKLPHYTMPLYPAVALLSARTLVSADAGAVPGLRRGVVRFGLNAWLVIGFVVTIAGPLALWWFAGARQHAAASIGVIGASALAMLGLAAIARALMADRFLRAQIASIAIMAIAAPVLLGLVLPGAHEPWVTRRISARLAEIDPDAQRPLAAVGYHEDSLIFATRGRVERLGEDRLGPWLSRHPAGIAIVPAGSAPAGVRTLASVAGFNYANGDPVDLRLITPGAESPTGGNDSTEPP